MTFEKTKNIFAVALVALLTLALVFSVNSRAEASAEDIDYTSLAEWVDWTYEESGDTINFLEEYKNDSTLSNLDYVVNIDSSALRYGYSPSDGDDLACVTLELTKDIGYIDVEVHEGFPVLKIDLEYSAAGSNYYWGEDWGAYYYIYIRDMSAESVRIDRSLFSADVCIEEISYFYLESTNGKTTLTDVDLTHVRYNEAAVSVHDVATGNNYYEESLGNSVNFIDVSDFFNSSGGNSGSSGDGGSSGSGGDENGDGGSSGEKEPETPETPKEDIDIYFYDELSIIESIGEKAYATITVGVDALTLPVAPMLQYYDFVAWYYLNDAGEEVLINASNFATFANALERDFKLYAKWDPHVLLTFNFFDGQAEVNEIYDLTETPLTAFPFMPEREGYEFKGWFYYNAENENVQLYAEDLSSIQESMTIYGRFEQLPEQEEISSDSGDESESSTKKEVVTKKWGLGLSNNITSIVWLVLIVVVLIIIFKKKKK